TGLMDSVTSAVSVPFCVKRALFLERRSNGDDFGDRGLKEKVRRLLCPERRKPQGAAGPDPWLHLPQLGGENHHHAYPLGAASGNFGYCTAFREGCLGRCGGNPQVAGLRTRRSEPLA